MTIQIADRLDSALRHARKVKEDHVRSVKGKRGLTDILQVVEAWRGADVVGAAFSQPDRDRMLAIADLFARGFGADMMVLTMETFQAPGDPGDTHGTNPDTGKRWGENELGAYFQRHGQDNGVVSEALFVSAYNRAGDEADAFLGYRIVGRRVEWDQERVADPNEARASRGIVPNSMRQIMSGPTAQQGLGAAYLRLGDDEEARLATADAATVKALTKIADEDPIAVMMFAEPGSKRHEIFRHYLGRSQVVDPRDWA